MRVEEVIIPRMERIEGKAFRDPVFGYLEWRSFTIELCVLYGEASPCPVCGETVAFNSHGVTDHFAPVLGSLERGIRRIDGATAFLDLYWGWECKTMKSTSWTAYKNDIPGLDRFARWWQNAYRERREPPVYDLFLFISRVAWRSRCEEVEKKQSKNLVRIHITKAREEDRFLQSRFGKRGLEKFESMTEAREFARNMIDLYQLKRRLKREPDHTDVPRKQRKNEAAHERQGAGL